MVGSCVMLVIVCDSDVMFRCVFSGVKCYVSVSVVIVSMIVLSMKKCVVSV